PGIRTAEIIDSMITLAKMANDSVDENKIISTTFGAGLEGGSGAKPTISNLGVTTAMLNNLAVTLGKMAVNSVDENKIISGIGDGTTIEGGSGSKLYIVGQPKFSATLSNGAVANIPDSISTTIIFNTLMYDIGTAYNVANGRFTPTIGYWHVDVQIMTDTLLLAVDKYIKLRFLRHNTLCFLFDKAFYGNGHTTNWHVGLSFDFYSDGTTYYEIQVLQNTGGATRLIGMPSNSYGNIFFNAHKIL
ncbi:MAG TPA: hypothetical protein DHW42_08405, partial [Candidatus Marinimicrobia bacterium]|nr:hypothetical protein [Candidatus Neomarinimicrobiota bacterium]